MWLLLLEAFLALCLLVFIVAWTMWPKRGSVRRGEPDRPGAARPAEGPAPEGDAARPAQEGLGQSDGK